MADENGLAWPPRRSHAVGEEDRAYNRRERIVELAAMMVLEGRLGGAAKRAPGFAKLLMGSWRIRQKAASNKAARSGRV